MHPRVIAELVSLLQRAPTDVRVLLQVSSDHEERRTRAGARECIEYGRSHFGIRTIVESNRDARAIARAVRDGRVEHAGGRPEDTVGEHCEKRCRCAHDERGCGQRRGSENGCTAREENFVGAAEAHAETLASSTASMDFIAKFDCPRRLPGALFVSVANPWRVR